MAVALSLLSAGLSAVFALAGATDVALVAVLVGTVSSLLVFGVFELIPRNELRRLARQERSAGGLAADTITALAAGASAFLLGWGLLSQTAARAGAAFELIERAPATHAQNVVAAILADFRGLDTLGEITVLTIAILGAMTLLRGDRIS
jgi:multicomponent Na+:H+ antiporter subunit A